MADVEYNSCQLFYPKRIADLRLRQGTPAGSMGINVVEAIDLDRSF